MKITAIRIGLLLSFATFTLAGCGGGDSVNSPVGDSSPAANKLTLNGTVTDDPVVNADIMFSVGSQDFMGSVPTGSTGDFQVVIESNDPDALVMGHAFDAANNVRLSGVLDTFEGCVDRAQNNVVNNVKITNITTAQKVLAERLALDGRVDTFDEFTELLPQIDAEELLELSAAIKVVVENINGTVLPSGVADTLALAKAIAAGDSSFLADLELVSPGALLQAKDKLLSDGNATVEFAAAKAPGVYKGLGNEFVYAVFNNGSALAEYFDDTSIPGTPSWSITAAGKLRLNFFGFSRPADDITLMSDNGKTLHMVTEFVSDSGQQGPQFASTVAKYDFGAPFSAGDVAGTYSDPRVTDGTWVLQQDGTGYAATQSSPGTQELLNWTVKSDGHLLLEYSSDERTVEIINLTGGADAGNSMVLSITRFNGQFPYLVTGSLSN